MSEKKGNFSGSLLAVLAKGAKLMKFIKVFKVAKPILTFVSMSVSMIAYAFWLGPWFAVLFTLLLFVHEMGHVAAMRMKGLGTPSPVFIPFLGAAIFSPKFENRHDEAFVGFGGPLLGTVAALAVFGMYFLVPTTSTFSPILLAASYMGIYLNLFNLIPMSPLDGGRVTQAVGQWFKYIGLILLASFSLMFKSPVILFIWILVLNDLSMIPIKIRVGLMALLDVAMVVLMFMGYSTQPWWLDTIDAIFASLFVGLRLVQIFVHDYDEEEDTRPDLPREKRSMWLILYLGLAVLLLCTIMIQIQYMPQHLHK